MHLVTTKYHATVLKSLHEQALSLVKKPTISDNWAHVNNNQTADLGFHKQYLVVQTKKKPHTSAITKIQLDKVQL
jgi:hypothetical protein